jgi:hypothetical protein
LPDFAPFSNVSTIARRPNVEKAGIGSHRGPKFYNLFHISNVPSLQKSASKKKIHGFSRSFQLLCPPIKAAKNLI